MRPQHLIPSIPALALGALAALVLPGCGGGGGAGEGADPAPAAQAVTVELPGIVATTDGSVVRGGGRGEDTQAQLQVGDSVDDAPVQGLLRFPLTSLLPGDRLVSAELILERVAPKPNAGGIPLGRRLVVSRTTLRSAADEDLLGSDFDATPLEGEPAFLAVPAMFLPGVSTGLGRQTVDVTRVIAADVASGEAAVALRLHFELSTDGDGQDDVVAFATTGLADPTKHPRLRLVVERTP